MASNLLAMGSNLVAMASNLIAKTSTLRSIPIWPFPTVWSLEQSKQRLGFSWLRISPQVAPCGPGIRGAAQCGRGESVEENFSTQCDDHSLDHLGSLF